MPLEKILNSDDTITVKHIAPFNKVQPSLNAPSHAAVREALRKLRGSVNIIQAVWLDTIEAFIKTR